MNKFILFFSILILSTACKQEKKDYFEAIAVNDIPLKNAAYGEWRYNRNEPVQTYEKYLKTSKIQPAKNKIIYLQPVGNFDSSRKKNISITQEYLQIYFQIETKTLNAESDKEIPKEFRRSFENHEQLMAGFFLDPYLKNRKQTNQLVCMAITEKDLYPRPEWNYVFGLASYKDGIGVTSMYRLLKKNDPDNNSGLLRLLKISSHEIGHMFGLAHCQFANCVMNGTNSLSETDRHSARLCSDCQRKLQSNLKYDNQKRQHELYEFFKKYDFSREAETLQKDINRSK